MKLQILLSIFNMNNETLKEMFLRTINTIDNYAKIFFYKNEIKSVSIKLPNEKHYRIKKLKNSSILTLEEWNKGKTISIISITHNTIFINNDYNIETILEDINNYILYLKLRDI